MLLVEKLYVGNRMTPDQIRGVLADWLILAIAIHCQVRNFQQLNDGCMFLLYLNINMSSEVFD
jgi:hypothetical protein